MVGNDVPRALEPETAELRPNSAFVGDGRGVDHVEAGYSVGGDQQKVLAKVVHIANFAAVMQLQAGQVRLIH